jgi:hypothetical protein
MEIQCRICGQPFRTLVVGDKGIQEISDALALHIKDHHGPAAAEIRRDALELTTLVTWYILVSTYANIPDKEEAIFQAMDKALSRMCELLGLEEDEEDEVKANVPVN